MHIDKIVRVNFSHFFTLVYLLNVMLVLNEILELKAATHLYLCNNHIAGLKITSLL